MKIGLIVESGPEGAEAQVFPVLIAKLGHRCTPSIATLSNKKKLVEECGKAASSLLEGGCRSVLILWDLYPAWREKDEKPCRREDREAIAASLRVASVAAGRVALVCIEEELEAWLIADRRAVSAVLSTAAHKVRVKDYKDPDGVRSPKTWLNKAFQKNGRGAYQDRTHAARIVRSLPDLGHIRRSESFARFEGALSQCRAKRPACPHPKVGKAR